MRLVSRALPLVAAGLMAIAVAPTARAQSAEDRETARSLFETGKTKRDKGDWAGALEAFKAADAIMNVPTTKLAVARAYAALGKLADARDAAVRVEQIPVDPKETRAFADARVAARDLAAELAPRIPTLVVSLKGAPEGDETTVTIDGSKVPLAALSAPRKMNPGSHVVVASLNGGEVKENVTIAEREAKTVTLDVGELAKLAKKKAADKPLDPSLVPERQQEKGSLSPLLWVGVGVAVVGVGVGATTGLMSMNKKSEVDAGCRDFKCPPSAYDALDGAKTLATISTIGFAVGGGGAILAGIGLAMGRSAPRKGQAPVQTFVGLGQVGLEGQF
jgi:hypothetical protein